MEISQTVFKYDVKKLDVTDSTNNWLRHIPLMPDVDFLFVTTEYQTAGKGQGNNRWESERGKNLLFSVKCLPWRVKASQQYLLLQTVAVAVCLVLRRQLCDSDKCRIKWPNDIYYGDKKLSGTLSECTLRNAYVNEFIAGVGINVNQLSFLSDAPNPVSMAQIAEHDLDRNLLLDEIAKELAYWFKYITNEDYNPIINKYQEIMYRRTGMHRYYDKYGEFEATYEDILPNGHLVLRRNDGTLSEYEFKEVKYIFKTTEKMRKRVIM